MSATFTDGTTTVSPIQVNGYETARASRNIVHVIIGRADPDVSIQPAGLRRGTLELLFGNPVDAEACSDLHAESAVFTYTDSDVPGVSMRYVLQDGADLETALDSDAGISWVVKVPYQEVAS